MTDETKAASGEKEMSFLEHLEELRKVVINSLIVLVVTSSACWFFSGWVMDQLVKPIGGAVFIGPAEAFTVRLKIAVVLGALASLPVIFFFLWKFVVPGLLHRERTALTPLALFSTVFFYGGAAFSYFMLVPVMMKILIGFGTTSVQPMISVNSYLSLVMQICLAMGLLFQFPLVVAALTWMGFLSPEWLKRKWRYAVVIIFIIGAVVTPGDGPSQLVVAFPIVGLYFLSILVSMIIRRRKEGEAAAEGEET
ncbi:MAG: twin-arginine translocase subunit TatC [Candidatus Eisenbacteria bacterium]|nr:twin-arginine translocase subunit TatC [Candidatus Eisenbacteria bacterium]